MLKAISLSVLLIFGIYSHAQSTCVDLCTGNVDPNTGEYNVCWWFDFNCDARVDVLDLPYQMSLYGCSLQPNADNYYQVLRADGNADGIVSISDLLIFIMIFGTIYE